MLNPVMGQVFLVTIYNRAVRALVKQNRSHTRYSDLWAEPRVQDVYAESEDEARDKAARRFPEEDGFVIENVERAH